MSTLWSRRQVFLGRPLFLLPWGLSRGPVLWPLMLVCKECALSISILAFWFHLLVVFGWSLSRGLYCWWWLTNGSAGQNQRYTDTLFTIWKVSRIIIFKKLPLEESSLFEFTIKDKRKHYQLLKNESKLAELEIGHSAIFLKSTAWNFGKQIVTNPGGG